MNPGSDEPEVAVELVQQIDWESTGFLLPLDGESRRRSLRLLRDEARMLLPKIDLDSEALARAGAGDLHLGEEIFEEAGCFSAAAALYALAHDEQLDGKQPPDGAEAPFLQLLLRFKLAWAAAEVNPANREQQRRCAELAASTCALLAASGQRLPRAAHNFLYFRLHHWLGLQWKELEEHRWAEDALGKAALYADDPQDRVSCHVAVADVKQRLNDHQGARNWLKLCEDDLSEAEEDTQEYWKVVWATSEIALGGTVRPEDLSALPTFARLAEIEQRLLEGRAPLDPQELTPMIDFLRQALSGLGGRDDDLRHGMLLSGAQLLFNLGREETCQEACLWLSWAEVLEGELGEERAIHRKILQARLAAQRRDLREALVFFAEVLPRVHQIFPAEKRLEVATEYLLALGKADTDLRAVLQLVPSVFKDLQTLLTEQPHGSARRRAREVHQRAVEAALGALVSGVRRLGQGSEAVQEALALAWRLLLNSRNIEIHWKPQEPSRGLEGLAEREGEFHRQLRTALRNGELEKSAWEAALRALEEHELSAFKDPRRSELQDASPPSGAFSAAFFQVWDLYADRRPVLVLSHSAGGFDFAFLDDMSGNLLDRLASWSDRFFETRLPVRGRGVTHDYLEGALWNEPEEAPGIGDLLPPRLVLAPVRDLQPSRPSHGAGVVDGGPPPEGESLSPQRWYLFPDGLFSTLPVEVLPDQAGSAVRFGQNRAVTLCLRPVVPQGVRKAIDFSRGWLGVGGPPAVGEVPELQGARAEIRGLQRLLEEQGFPCDWLLGEEARADRLEQKLSELRPAVLHLAVHGFADRTHPDACTLVLADCPDRPERELLPYRRIRDLPLAGVELVVLSACSSLLGKGGRAASMEGLAWAFLGRGVTQVIASRYPVDDEHTVTFMDVLYRHLLTIPVADALGRTRDVCLVEKGLPLREVGAWSVWC